MIARLNSEICFILRLLIHIVGGRSLDQGLIHFTTVFEMFDKEEKVLHHLFEKEPNHKTSKHL